jgi:hypothetical protein
MLLHLQYLLQDVFLLHVGLAYIDVCAPTLRQESQVLCRTGAR